MLCGDTKGSLISLLKLKKREMIEAIIDAFQPSSNANLYHVCKIILVLLDVYPEDVLHVIGNTVKKAQRYLPPMLDKVHEPPVYQVVLTLLANNKILSVNGIDASGKQSNFQVCS